MCYVLVQKMVILRGCVNNAKHPSLATLRATLFTKEGFGAALFLALFRKEGGRPQAAGVLFLPALYKPHAL